MENKDLSKSIKVKFLFILFFSNASIFLFSSSFEASHKQKTTSGPRVDYIVLKVLAENKTSLNSHSPIQMVSNNYKTIVKNIFVLEKVDRDESKLTDFGNSLSHYLIHIHAEDAKRINLAQNFLFFPNKYTVKKSNKRRRYEVIF